jgi:hypothetical protein
MKLVRAAQAAGLTASPIPTLLVEGDNKPGLGHAIAGVIAESAVNLAFIRNASDWQAILSSHWV